MLNKFYNSDGEPGHFCDMENIEDTQYFDDYALPDVFPHDADQKKTDYESNWSVPERGYKSNHDSCNTLHVDIP